MGFGGQYQIRVHGVLDDTQILAQLAAIEKRFGALGSGAGGASGVFGKAGKDAGVVATNTGKAAKSAKGYQTAMAGATKETKKFGSGTLDVTKKVIQFGAITAVIRGVTSGIGDMVRNVYELDTALTEFKKVSDLSGDGLKAYTDEAYKLGRTVAKTGTEMVQASTEFRKSGYSDEDSLQLAKVASWIQDECVVIHIENRVNCWKPKYT